MKIGIVTPTYRKLDGSTYSHLKTTLESIKNQTHSNYKLYLIGDDYTNNDELLELSKIIDTDKIYVQNLPIAYERIKYGGYDLWKCGGINATLTGIKKAQQDGYDYICLLNHDDLFLPNHLQIISECIDKTKTNFITTKCGTYPPINVVNYYTNYRPIPSKLYLVSVCINYSYFNIFPRNVLEEDKISYPSDADLWVRLNKFMTNNNEYGIFINENTCIKIGGGITYARPNIVK